MQFEVASSACIVVKMPPYLAHRYFLLLCNMLKKALIRFALLRVVVFVGTYVVKNGFVFM